MKILLVLFILYQHGNTSLSNALTKARSIEEKTLEQTIQKIDSISQTFLNVNERFEVHEIAIEKCLILGRITMADSILNVWESSQSQFNAQASIKFLNRKGYIKFYQDELNQAAEYFLEANKISQSIGDQQGIYKNKNNLGVIYMQLKKLDEAEKIYDELRPYFEDKKDSIGLYGLYNNYAIIHSEKRDFGKAKEYYELSSTMAKDPSKRVITNHNLAIVEEELGNLEGAITLYDQVISESIKLERGQNRIGEVQLNKAKCLRKIGRYSEAINIYGELISTYNSQDSILKFKTLYHELSELEKSRGNYKQAYLALEDHIDYLLKFRDNNSALAIDSLRDVYELEKKELQIEKLDIENNLQASQINSQRLNIWLMGLTLTILTFILYKIFRFYRVATIEKQNVLNANKQLRTEIDKLKNDPHRLLNLQWVITRNRNHMKVKFQSIIAVKANNHIENNTIDFVLDNNENKLFPKIPLSTLDDDPSWPKQIFKRIHHSHIINLYRIQKFNESTSIVYMDDGSHYSLSKSYEEDFINAYEIKKKYPEKH